MTEEVDTGFAVTSCCTRHRGQPMDDLDLDNPAWRFALALYGRDGVATECLVLQDDAGLDVSLLLVCLWLGAERGVVLSAADLDAAETIAGPWRRVAVERLRLVRRELKTSPEIGHAAVVALRKRVQAIEIEAERVEIALLHAWAGRFSGARPEFGPRAAELNLASVLAWAGRGSAPATPRLRSALRMPGQDDGPDLACRDA